MKTYELEPLDTLFFRDSQPFNLGETGQMEVDGIFPPFPATVVGTLRAALARGQDWTRGDWNPSLKTTLGNHEDLANLRFCGPYLLHHKRPLFPAPLLLMGKRTQDVVNPWANLTRLVPGPSFETDLGSFRLPVHGERKEALKPLRNTYLTLAGMERVLAGQLPNPDQVLAKDSLWCMEPRVGIRREPATRTTGDDSLYQISHVRLREHVRLGVQVEGLPDSWEPVNPTPLGGESRLAWIEATDPFPLPQAPTLQAENRTIRYFVTLLTPADWPDGSWRTPGDQLGSLPGKIISACVGKALNMGGWDSVREVPNSLVPLLPPGSTWFIEATDTDPDEIGNWHGKHLGKRTEWGYGQILIGTWKEVS